jgi:hypothetical protein
MQAFITISTMACEIVARYWYVTLALTALAVAGLVIGNPTRTQAFRRVTRLFGAAYVMPILVVAIGTVLRYDHGSPPVYHGAPPISYAVALYVPIVIYLVVFLGCVVSLRGWRLRSAALLGPGLWFSACATIPAGFAIAGVGP